MKKITLETQSQALDNEAQALKIIEECKSLLHTYFKLLRKGVLHQSDNSSLYKVPNSLFKSCDFLSKNQALTFQHHILQACGYLMQAELSFKTSKRVSYARYKQVLSHLDNVETLQSNGDEAVTNELKIETYISLGQRGIIDVRDRVRHPKTSNIDITSTKWFDEAMLIADNDNMRLRIQLFKSKFKADGQNYVEAYKDILQASNNYQDGIAEDSRSDLEKLKSILSKKLHARYIMIIQPTHKYFNYDKKHEMYTQAIELADVLQYDKGNAIAKLDWLESYQTVCNELSQIKEQFRANQDDKTLIKLLNKHVYYARICLVSCDKDVTIQAFKSTMEAQQLLKDNPLRLNSLTVESIKKSIEKIKNTTYLRSKVFKIFEEAKSYFREKHYENMISSFEEALQCVKDKPLRKMIAKKVLDYHNHLSLRKNCNDHGEELKRKILQDRFLTDEESHFLSLQPDKVDYSQTIKGLSDVYKALSSKPNIGQHSIFKQDAQHPRILGSSSNSGGGARARQR